MQTYHWPTESPQAVIALVHGFGEHAGRYQHVAEFFNANGYAVTACDLPGHGRSPGKRGHVAGYGELLDTVDQLLAYTQSLYPPQPVVLFGHSMGGNIVANYLIRRQPALAAAVIQAPWLRMPTDPPKLEVFVGKLTRGVLPSVQLPTKLDPATVSSDPAVVEAYRNDPLVHDKITPGWYFGALEAQTYAIENAAEINLPTLLMHGTADRLAAFSGAEDLARNAGPNLTLKAWEGFYHELHNEPRKVEVLAYVRTWLQEKLVKSVA